MDERPKIAGIVLWAGVILAAVGVLAGLAPVATEHGGCGTWLAPSAPDDMVWGPACETAQASRTPFVLVPGLLGLVLLAVSLAWRLGRRSRRGVTS